MDPTYVNVMGSCELAYVALVYLLRAVVAVAQIGVACFLLVIGARRLVGARAERRAQGGALHIGSALMLVAPVAIGAPVAVSILGAPIAFGLLVLPVGRHTPQPSSWRKRAVRRSAVAIAAILALFMLWEGEDNLTLRADLLVDAVESRNDEIAWQHANDPRSPKVGDLAPDFELQDPAGRVQVRLSGFRDQRPVALVIGSFTCPPFSNGAVRLKELFETYRDDVEFIVVYVKEAHASGAWWLGRTRTQRLANAMMGSRDRIDIVETMTLEQRRKVAASCEANLFDGVVPLYVDTMSNQVAVAYTARPTRIYWIGRDGRVLYNPGIGPFGFNPDYLGAEIERYRSQEQGAGGTT